MVNGQYNKMIKLIIKGKPISVNRSYGKTAKSFYMTQVAKNYKLSSAKQARLQYKGEPIEDKLEVTYYYYFPDRRVRDHLNLNKGLNDALNGIVWNDDKQIVVSHHYEKYDKEDPRVELNIIKYEE